MGLEQAKYRSVLSVLLKIRSRVSTYEIELVCHILPIIIEGMPGCSIPMNSWNIPQELVPQLADPSFHSPGAIDLLIGGGVLFDVTSTTVARMPLNVKNVF